MVGNPGMAGFYKEFMAALHAGLEEETAKNAAVLAFSYIGRLRPFCAFNSLFTEPVLWCTYLHALLWYPVIISSVVDPDPVGSVSFCRIRNQIDIQGLPAGSYSTNCKAKIWFFPWNFNILSNYFNVHLWCWQYRLAFQKVFCFFPTCVKLGVESGSWSASKWKVRSGYGSASKRSRSTTIDTAGAHESFLVDRYGTLLVTRYRR